MHRTLKITVAVALMGILYTSCKKTDIPLSQPEAEGPVAEGDPTMRGILPFPLAWETANFMPTPPGTNTIGMPWGSGVNQNFDSELSFDYKASDGWELVYNTFNTTTLTTPKHFMLYNKFRGLFRIYLYLDPNAPSPSSYITHSLRLAPVTASTSSLLNFAGTDIVDVSTNRLVASEIQQFQILTTGSWQIFQFEMAYDPNITNLSFLNLNLRWSAGFTNVTNVNLAGQINGTLKGTVGTPAEPTNILGQLGRGVLMFTGKKILDNNPTLLPTKIMSAAKEAIDKGLQGVVKNVFNGIFGGNSNNVQQVNLNLNASMNLTGTLVNSGGLLNKTFAIPGTANSINAPTYSPGYTSPMGVFNISARPKVRVTSIRRTPPPTWDGPANRYFDNSFSIIGSSFAYQYNPAVTAAGATIQLLEQKIFLPEGIAVATNHFYNYPAVTEDIGESTYYNADGIIDGIQIRPATGAAVVRVVLRVTPPGGGAPVTIVKGFLADIVL